MKMHTTFKIGGPADYYVTPVNKEQLKRLIELFNEEKIAFYIIGNGSNLLVSDEGYRGAIIQLYDKFSGYEIVSACDDSDKVRVKALAGMSLIKLGRELAENSLTGFEFASGIPGSLGGAVVMNAGAYGGEIKDVIISATVLDRLGNEMLLTNDELELGYRTSVVAKKDLIVTEVELEFKKGDKEEIKKNMMELSRRRIDKQPLEYPSAGSTFKRPEGYFAGKLIEDAGLKGYAVGGAKVSDKHAGFVVNVGRATAKDVISLTDNVSEKVFEQFGVKLELEVKKLGF
ncbi:MAG: UDP-N-acetylmuramate dehydrogenase [Lachnospira sp.]|nr:UDP-N-acetylmuramate dehydrogenase [Lachnospira sp.]